MIRLTSLFSLLLIGLNAYSISRDSIDQYNEQTIDLLDDLDSCLLRIDYAIIESENIGYEYGKAYALYLKGYIHRMQDDLGKAFLANLNALDILQNINDDRKDETLVRLYLNTGEALKKHFKFLDAIDYYKEGLSIAESKQLKNWEIDLKYNIGNAYWVKGDLDTASDYIYEAYQLALNEGDEHTIVNALNLMGLVFKDSHQNDTAALFFNKMLEYEYQNLDADKYKGRAYHNLANTYAQAGDTVNAIATFYKALEHKQRRNKPKEIFITENDLAELYYLQGDYDMANQIVENCILNYKYMRLDPDHYKVFDLARKVNSAMNNHSMVSVNADKYFEENKKFIQQQQDLIVMRDQFKMEVLTASFFGELERNKRISNLNTAIVCILIIATVIIGYLKIRQIFIKSVVNKELDKLVRN